MKSSRIALGLFLIALPVVAGCANVVETLRSLPRPSADVVGVRLTGLDFESVSLTFDVAIDNPLSVDVPLVNVDVDLASRGTSFLSGDVPLQGMVPAGGTRTVECPVRVDLLRTVRLLTDVRPGQVIDYGATLGLSLDVPGIGPQRLPLRKEGQLPIPAVPTVSLGSLRLDRADLRGVEGTAVVEVGNPNAFGVVVDALDLGLSLGGRPVGDLSAASAMDLSAGGSGSVEIPLRLNPLELGTAVLEVLSGGNAAYGLRGGLSLDTPFGRLSPDLVQDGQVPIVR